MAVGRREAPLQETAELVRAAGGICIAHVADAGDEAAMQGALDRCVQELGGLEVFFANAGNTDSVTPFLEQTVAQWQAMFSDNVVPAFLACKLAGRHMAEHGGGSIILNSSTGSLRARGGTEAYGAAKAAVNHLTMTAACAFAGRNVRVNAILPGLTETGLTKPMFDWARTAGKEDRLGKLTPCSARAMWTTWRRWRRSSPRTIRPIWTGSCCRWTGISATHPAGSSSTDRRSRRAPVRRSGMGRCEA